MSFTENLGIWAFHNLSKETSTEFYYSFGSMILEGIMATHKCSKEEGHDRIGKWIKQSFSVTDTKKDFSDEEIDEMVQKDWGKLLAFFGKYIFENLHVIDYGQLYKEI